MPLGKKDVVGYVSARVRLIGTTPPFAPLAKIWQDAGREFSSGKPDNLIKLLLDDLAREENMAEKPKDARYETCSGPAHARQQHAKNARRITDLLWCIADEHGALRVWGNQLTNREVQRAIRSENHAEALQNLLAERNEGR